MKRHYKQRIARNEQLRKTFRENVETFLVDKALVRDHQLQGKMGLMRAFCITDDYRLIYLEFAQYYLFDDVGTHAQVYRR